MVQRSGENKVSRRIGVLDDWKRIRHVEQQCNKEQNGQNKL
jgi:hypothetical protein